MKAGGICQLETTPSSVTLEAIRQVREQGIKSLRLQAGEISRLEETLELLRKQQRETEEAARHLLETMEKNLSESGGAEGSSSTLPDALERLAQFARLQLDRLTLLRGAMASGEVMADEKGAHVRGPAATREEEQKFHRDAKRFARLLVSEIELYNKAQVEEGRKKNDLYQRLKKDIDRRRQAYEKRFGNSVAKQVDYFHDKLVRALAENDPALLGSDYPGPSA